MSFPNLSFWSNLLGATSIEVCVVVALGIAAQSAFRRAWWKRAMWQMTLLCLTLVFASEWTGAGRGAVWSLLGPKHANRAGAPLTVSPNVEFYTPKGMNAISPPPPAPKKAVWWPGWVWLAGTVLVLGRMATAQGLLLALRFRREKIADDVLRERVNRIASMLGLRRNVCLLRLPESISPMAFGVLFPTIGLPPKFEDDFSAAEQEAILAHELAHLAVHDPLWFRLADFASALLWWHPLVWCARRSLHGASELAADEATALVPDGPGSLAHCLVSLGKKMTVSRGWGWTGINGGFRSKLGKRVERLTRLTTGSGKPFVSWRDRVVRIAATILIVPSVVLLFGAFQTAHGERENSLRDSWNNSPGMLLAMAAAEETDDHENKPMIAGLLQDAKSLYEKDKFDEAELILVHVLKHDPSNKIAASYLAIVKEARSRDVHNKMLQIWAEHEVVTRADYLNYSNILSKLGTLPETNLGAELLTTYTNLADSELKEKSIQLSYAKEELTARKAQYGTENPKYKAALEKFQQAKDDYDNKAVAIFEGIKARVDQSSKFLQIITKNEEDIRNKMNQQTEIPAIKGSNQTAPQVAMAALDTTETPTKEKEIATRVMDAKLYYEMGKLAESEAILTDVIKDDPSNQTAAYYLNLIKEAQFMDRQRQREGRFAWDGAPRSYSPRPQTPVPIPNATDTANLLQISAGRQDILSNLNTLRMQEVSYDLPLSEVLKQLTVWSQKADPKGRGINFLFNPHLDAAGTYSRTDFTGTAPAGAIPITVPTPAVDMSTATIKISPALADVRLVDVLNAIVMCADQPIQYKVEDYAVVFSPKPAKQVALFSKTYHFDPNTFIQSIQRVTGATLNSGIQSSGGGVGSQQGSAAVGLSFETMRTNTVQLDSMVRSYFESAGVDMTEPGKSLFFSDRSGLMLVHASAEDLEKIDKSVAALNQKPPQVVSQEADLGFPKPPKDETLYSRAFQLNPTEFKKNLLPAVGIVPSQDAGKTNDTAQMNRILQAYFSGAGAKFTAPAETIVYEDRAGVLIVHATTEKLQTIEQALEPLNKMPPQVTIETKFVDLSQQDGKALGYDSFLQAINTNLTSVMSDKQFRDALDNLKHNSHSDILAALKVTLLSGRQAHVASTDNDGYGKALDVIPTVGPDGFSINLFAIANVKEHDRNWQAVATQKLWDGQTLVIGQMVADPNSDGKMLRLVFVTPTIIDPAGNRVHTDEELSDKYKQAP